ncbi:hypothetical protein MTO96_036926 [Rhipicephalus appendiculatus]
MLCSRQDETLVRGPKAFEGGITSRSQLKRLCSAEACRRAVDALVDNMLEWDDSSSCAEFGKQACGGWTKLIARRLSFEEEALEQSIERLHTAMLRMSQIWEWNRRRHTRVQHGDILQVR